MKGSATREKDDSQIDLEKNLPKKLKSTLLINPRNRSQGVKIRILNLEKNVNVSAETMEKSLKTDLPGSVSPFTSYFKQSQVVTPESKSTSNQNVWFVRGLSDINKQESST